MQTRPKRIRIRPSKPMGTKLCAICGKEFPSNHPKAKYCSDTCYAVGQIPLHKSANRKRTGIPDSGPKRIWIVCETVFPPANPNQKRCQGCIDNPQKHAPTCACGCGAKTSWQPTIGYARFVTGHSHRKAGFGVSRWLDAACITCGTVFTKRTEKSKNCSRECYAESRRGMNHERFKGGRSKYVFKKDAVTGAFRRTHRVAMEEKIGRKLKWHEIVHHIEDENGGRSEDISRLFLFHCDRCHHHHHMTGKALRYRYVPAHMKNGVPIGLPKRKPNQQGK